MRSLFPFLVVFSFAINAHAVPLLINHQGRLLDSSDQPLTGTHQVSFRLWDAATGSPSVWLEIHNLTFDNGYYSVVLGETNPVDENTLDAPALWLSLTIGGEELLPRHRVVSAPYAVMAATAENVVGGIVDASSISVGGTEIVDSSGDWVGAPPPDTLSGLGCDPGQLVAWNGTGWGCIDPSGAEADPIYSAAPAAGIDSGDITNWDTAYGWGDHGSVGYLSTEDDPQVATLIEGNWCAASFGQVSCDQPAPVTVESDPQVDSTTAGSWCVGNGSQVTCNQAAPLTAESDPQVGSLTSGRWCTSNGSSVNCTTSAPVDTRCDSTTCGTVTAAGFTYSTTQTSYTTLHGTAFTPLNSTDSYGTANNGAYRYLSSGTAMVAAIQLPHGATLTNLTMRVYDNSTADITIVGLVNQTTNTWICFSSAGTTGASSTVQDIDMDCSSHTINNDTGLYYLRWIVSNGATCGANCRLYGAKATYTYTTEAR